MEETKIEVRFSGQDLSLLRRMQRGTGLQANEVIDNAMEVTARLWETLSATPILVFPQAIGINDSLRQFNGCIYTAEPSAHLDSFDFYKEFVVDEAERYRRLWQQNNFENWIAFTRRSLAPYACLQQLYVHGGNLVTRMASLAGDEQLLDLREHFRPPMDGHRG